MPDPLASRLEYAENDKIPTARFRTHHTCPCPPWARALVCHKDHPADTEFVGHHAESRREERLAHRHLHLPAIGETGKKLVGIGLAVGRDRQHDAMKIRLAAAAAV